MSEEPRACSTFDLVSFAAELLAIPIFGVVVIVISSVATWLAAVLAGLVGLRPLRSELGLATLFVLFLTIISVFLTRYSPVSQRVLDCRLEVWPHGIAYGWGKALRFVPYARIRDVERDALKVRLTLAGGGRIELEPLGPKRPPSADDPGEADRAQACRALARLIEEGVVREKNAASARIRTKPPDFETTLAVLARRGRPVAEWHAELASLAGDAGARYRVATLRDDTLVRITHDSEVDEDARDAAQRVLDVRRGQATALRS